MVKQYLAAVLEDLIGEYVLNISKENLKLAALKGRIKLDNVELDGDYIGSHVISALGLQGFGVLSCYAKSLQIHIPWKNLDEPTSLEIHGMHLLCVPLLPTTATRMYYGGGISGGLSASQSTLHDVVPRCSLRTRAKRSAIARFERSFFSGRIPGEGPQIEKEESDSRTLNYNGRRQRWSLSVKDDEDVFSVNSDADSVNDIPTSSINAINGSEHSDTSSATGKQTLKQKITTKIYQNLISSINDVHIRFEVPEGALDMSLTGRRDNVTNTHQHVDHERLIAADQKAFAFGVVLQKLSVHNVLEDVHKNQAESLQDKSCKTIEISNMSMYWDDGPPFLITESDSIQGLFSVPMHKLQKRVAEIMKQMAVKQDPGDDLRKRLNSLSSPARVPFARKHSKSNDSPAHEYVCKHLTQTIHTTYTTETSGDTTYFVDILPSKIDIDATSQQYRKYQLLKNAILSQQRFDTMLHGRPKKSPRDDPKSWWRYAIKCVQHRPNSRTWGDVQQIIRCRKKYISLVVKNLESETEQSGFHGGLSSLESQTLLGLENFLPIETLLAFHLLALRNVFDRRCTRKAVALAKAGSLVRKKSSNSLSRLWKSVRSGKNSTSLWRPLDDFEFDSKMVPMLPESLESSRRSLPRQRDSMPLDDSFVIDATHRDPSNKTIFELRHIDIQISLLDLANRTKIVAVEIGLKGKSNSGYGNEEYTCDILRFEVFDYISGGPLSKGKVLSVEPISKTKYADSWDEATIIENDVAVGDNAPVRVSSSMSSIEDPLYNVIREDPDETLPSGVVCSVTAVANHDEISLSLVAHPATIVWNNTCADKVAEFFYTSTPDVRNQFLNQLRSATTKGAHKRQLELLFPTTLSISVDIHAPKLWLPVSSTISDGALYIDAGRLKVGLIKPAKVSNTRYGLELNDIEIKFLHEDPSCGGSSDKPKVNTIDLTAVHRLHNEIVIIYPFNIGVTGISIESVEIPLMGNFSLETSGFDESKESMSGEMSVDFGPIRLNLVDVEVLAKALGRFYAAQIIRLKSNPSKRDHSSAASGWIEQTRNQKTLIDVSLAFDITMSFQHIQVALESYETKSSSSEKKSRNRTYLMDARMIMLQQRSKGLKQFSRLTISDVSIVQLSESKQNRRRVLKPGSEPQHQILERRKNVVEESPDSHKISTPPMTPTTKTNYNPLITPKELHLSSRKDEDTSQTEFIRACHYHDGDNHVDEVEVDIAQCLVRVTPTSIVDLTKASTRLFELVQLTTTEMERKVHAGRRSKLRAQRSKPGLNDFEASALSPITSLADDEYDRGKKAPTDSSIIYRVTFAGASIFVGRPAAEFTTSRASKRHGAAPHDYVIQVLTNSSILAQSIENSDSSGSKTAHLSLQDLSASISNTWAAATRINNPCLFPSEVDLRAVYSTVDEGFIVSQDFSFDCESLRCCVLPHDVTVILSISRKVIEKLNAIQTASKQPEKNTKAIKGFLPSIVRVKEKGSGIATNIRFELSTFSLVSKYSFDTGRRPFLEFQSDSMKLRLDGAAACLTGDFATVVKLNFYHPVSGWEHFVEPVFIQADISRMPDEQIIAIKSTNMINVNFTGRLLEELSNLGHSRKDVSSPSDSNASATSITFTNCTGMDIIISLSPDDIDPTRTEGNCIKDGDSITLKSLFPESDSFDSISLHASGLSCLSGLPLVPKADQAFFLYRWPQSSSPVYDLEPVVETVMQNQRLRYSVVDIYSLDRGKDLLSSTNWSPEFNSAEEATGNVWQKPYLEGDCPEFSDKTCRLKRTKDSIRLPIDWMWANDWEVEVHGELGTNNDTDGWEYSADFETFTAESRSYKRGDSCRRRRWIRHRVFKPSSICRSYRLVWELKREENGHIAVTARSHLRVKNYTSIPLALFGRHCASSQDDEYIGYAGSGSTLSIPVQLASVSHLRLAVQKEKSYIDSESTICDISNYAISDHVIILPSGPNTNRVLRTAIMSHSSATTDRFGLKALRNLHFLLVVTSSDGICDVQIQPVLTLINLLPCQIQCQLGESVGRRSGLKGKQVVQTEEVSIAVGKTAGLVSVDCRLKPHVSIRLPGYRWSAWNRIVNRQSSSQTWLPLEDEQATLFDAHKEDAEHSTEYKTIIHLDNKCTGGPSVNLIMSVEAGHSPTIRVYAQYWILDKSGFGLRFTDNFDIIGQQPDPDSLRQSFLSLTTANNSAFASDMKRQGCEWSIGMNGMTLFFSKRERVSLSVVHDEELKRKSNKSVSRWSSFIDISKAISKTIISVDDHDGKKRFELAYDITSCPSLFSRTYMIQIFPRYQIANLLQKNVYLAQDGTTEHHLIPSQSWLPFHWDISSLDPKIRLSCQVDDEPGLWTQGCVSLDQIGITAIRIPKSDEIVVVQVEVRLATKKQSSAVVVLIWSSTENDTSNPLYTLRNDSKRTVFCCQPLLCDSDQENALAQLNCGDDVLDESRDGQATGALGRIARRHQQPNDNSAARDSKFKSIIREVLRGECAGIHLSDRSNRERSREFVWTLMPGDSIGFGFDNPEFTHMLQWTCLTSSALLLHGEDSDVGHVNLDVIGAVSTVLLLDGDEIKCEVKAEQSTKVVVFSDSTNNNGGCDEELASLVLSVEIPGVTVSIIDNQLSGNETNPREIMLVSTERWLCIFSQTRDGIHELEVKLSSFQADNFIHDAEHPVLIYTPTIGNEPFVHCSIVRHLNEHESTYVVSYAAIRILPFDISLDRKTAEALAAFLMPLRRARERNIDVEAWITSLTLKMSSYYSKRSRKAPRNVEQMIHSANSLRVYIENLALHPIRINLTFTQEWLPNAAAADGLIIFQLVRGTASIADAPITFTSFLVGNAFESPQSLRQIILAHYNSQLTSQILPLIFNMAILKGPVEFVSNIGSGVVRFFYEPINALVYSPEKFVEGLEVGTHHLARGVFTGVVKGAANLTYLVNNNLVTLASDEAFTDTRRAYQKQIESSRTRTIEDSLTIAGDCIARGFQSGTAGIFEQPAIHASRHGSVGLVTGVGRAVLGAIVKPVVGLGDAAAVLMNHVGDVASEKVFVVKETKRMRRALPRISAALGNNVKLVPFDVISAKAQRIVTGGETVDDTYIGHVTLPSHLIIASTQGLWAIDADSRDPWCISWTEISHYSIDAGNCLTITVFTSQGQQSFVFNMSSVELAEFDALLSMQKQKMGNMNALGTMTYAHLPGVKSPQAAHIFGSINTNFKVRSIDLGSDTAIVERCYSRVNILSSSAPDFFLRLDEEAWLLVNSSTQLFKGLSSRRCVCIGILNGSNETIQIKTAALHEGGSECYTIPSKEYNNRQGTLEPGGAIIIFGWGVAPSLLQSGRVLINVETNIFSCSMSDRKGQDTTIHSLPGYQVGFLEKSYDESGWWAKYWLLIKKDDQNNVKVSS